VASAARRGPTLSVTGGAVCHGTAIPGLAGHYLFSDWCGGWIRSLAPGTHALVDWGLSGGAVTSFGTDGRGEVYVVAGNGSLFRIVPAR